MNYSALAAAIVAIGLLGVRTRVPGSLYIVAVGCVLGLVT